jgi:uncharacterized protein (TIGR02996 family)
MRAIEYLAAPGATFWLTKRGPVVTVEAGMPLTEEECFLAKIREQPEEDTHRLVYADWLQEHGDLNRASFIRAGFNPVWIPTTPTPLQWAWLQSESREVWFQGGAGAGKTEALLMAVLQYATSPKYRALLLVPTFAALTQSSGIMQRLGGWLKREIDLAWGTRNGKKRQWISSDQRIVFPHGAEIQLGTAGIGFERYLGGYFSFVGIDHASVIPAMQREQLLSRARPMAPEIPVRCRLAG